MPNVAGSVLGIANAPAHSTWEEGKSIIVHVPAWRLCTVGYSLWCCKLAKVHLCPFGKRRQCYDWIYLHMSTFTSLSLSHFVHKFLTTKYSSPQIFLYICVNLLRVALGSEWLTVFQQIQVGNAGRWLGVTSPVRPTSRVRFTTHHHLLQRVYIVHEQTAERMVDWQVDRYMASFKRVSGWMCEYCETNRKWIVFGLWAVCLC